MKAELRDEGRNEYFNLNEIRSYMSNMETRFKISLDDIRRNVNIVELYLEIENWDLRETLGFKKDEH